MDSIVWQKVEWNQVEGEILDDDRDTRPGQLFRYRNGEDGLAVHYLIYHENGQRIDVTIEEDTRIVDVTVHGEFFLHRCATSPPSPDTEIPSTDYGRITGGRPAVRLRLSPYELSELLRDP
jgi:hypothetical protein